MEGRSKRWTQKIIFYRKVAQTVLIINVTLTDRVIKADPVYPPIDNVTQTNGVKAQKPPTSKQNLYLHCTLDTKVSSFKRLQSEWREFHVRMWY